MDALAQYLARPWLRFYEKGVPNEIELPQKSVSDLFDEATDRWSNRPALIFYGREISYRELRDAADRLAHALAALGVRKGDRVALLLLNSPQFVIACFAALKCGAVVTPISPMFTSHEVRAQLESSGARAVICQDILYEKIARSQAPLDLVVVTRIGEYLPAVKRALGKLLLGVNLGTPVVPPAPHLHWLQDLLRSHPAEPPQVPIDPSKDLAAIPYTAGTTDHPKGVMLTHRNLMAAALASRTALPLLDEGKEVALAFLPFSHIYGLVTIMLNGLAEGDLLVLFTSPDTEAILAAMERHRATVFFGVPTLFEYLKTHKDTDKVDWRRLKLLLSGADTLHEATLSGWMRRTGAPIVEGYGLTECCASSHVNPPGRPKAGSFGCPMPNMVAAVAHPETLEFLPQGETGELLLSGPTLMAGYWNEPEASARALVERAGRRWLRTGDIVTMDEEGYFHFYDRSKDLIKYKGFSVFAKEVEDALRSHPQVKAAGVIGVPDQAVGNLIKAIVVLNGDARGKLGGEELRSHCRERLAEYKIPQIVEFRGELPKTEVGKVSRRELREEHAST